MVYEYSQTFNCDFYKKLHCSKGTGVTTEKDLLWHPVDSRVLLYEISDRWTVRNGGKVTAWYTHTHKLKDTLTILTQKWIQTRRLWWWGAELPKSNTPEKYTHTHKEKRDITPCSFFSEQISPVYASSSPSPSSICFFFYITFTLRSFSWWFCPKWLPISAFNHSAPF